MDHRNAPVFTRVPVLGMSLHRWLVGIPVILYVGTVVLFALHAYDHDPTWLREAFAANIAAILAAVIAAGAGLVDFLQIPKSTRARSIGLRHASFMVVVLALFVTNLATCFDTMSSITKHALIAAPSLDPILPLAISGTGLAIALLGGALGLALAHRFHVGEVPLDTAHGPGSIKPRFR